MAAFFTEAPGRPAAELPVAEVDVFAEPADDPHAAIAKHRRAQLRPQRPRWDKTDRDTGLPSSYLTQ
jgi:hypothetical protein